MTTELDFRRALAADPDDADARTVFADWLDEQDRPREACVNRIVAQPDEDRHRLDFAAWLERTGHKQYARLIHWTFANGEPHRDSLMLQDEVACRRVTCSTCNGFGHARENCGGPSAENVQCPDCGGTGDVGGLTCRFDTSDGVNAGILGPQKIHWRRGCPERVECRLADVVEKVSTPAVHGIGFTTVHRVTDWARRVCRWHPVLELWITDKESVRWSRSVDAETLFMWSIGPHYSHSLPELAFDALRDYDDIRDGQKMYSTEPAAHAALARGLARLARA